MAAASDFAAPRLRSAERYTLIALLVFVAAAAVATTVSGGRDLPALLSKAGPFTIVVPILLASVNFALRTFRWQLFTNAQSISIPWRPNALIYLAGFALTATPGKVGEALRLWLLRRVRNVGYDRSLPLLVADRLVDAISICILCLVGVAAFTDYLVPALIAASFILVITAVTSSRRALRFMLRTAYAVVRRRARLFAKAGLAFRRMERLTRSPALIWGLGLGLIGWSCEAMGLHALLHSLGATVEPLQTVFIFAFATLVGALILVPGGLGGTEATMIGLLASSGVGMDIAVVGTILFRVTTLWFGILVGYSTVPFAMRLKPLTRGEQA